MTRLLSLLLLLLTFSACTAQKRGLTLAIDQEHVKERKDFDTQGEQEDYWARKLFQEHYRYQVHPKFNGTIWVKLVKQMQLVSYDRDTLRLVDVDDAFLPLFTEGTLYPTVAGMNFHQISIIEELKNATNSPKRRRFTFMVFSPFTLNPTKYIFEVKNESASTSTDTKTFMQGAMLTFVKQGWLMM